MTHVERRQPRQGKESIHSGHFMVSHFEAEAQDEFDDLAVPVLDEEQNAQKVTVISTYNSPGAPLPCNRFDKIKPQHQQLSIETSLTKLFKCMTLAYRQKLTSPKWNRFKGIKLRWKDKIRLNNVIWRCWHMQFIKKQNTLVCQFASPLDVDTHVKPETTILEGKYWKRRAEAVIAEYKKWRMFHIMRLLGKGDTSVQDTISDMDTAESFSQCSDLAGAMLTDEDYLNFMSDTLFSTISSHQPFAFPDTREIARGASLADFIQPSLGPLQPNLDDFMDTLEPLHALSDILTPRLPPVPEEPSVAEQNMYRGQMVDSYNHGYMTSVSIPPAQMSIHSSQATNSGQMVSQLPPSMVKHEQSLQAAMSYESARLFPGELQPGPLDAPAQGYAAPLPARPPPPHHHPQQTQQQQPPIDATFYGGGKRLQFGAPTKQLTHQETTTSYKFPTVIPPSQTAPETVSLLQQPLAKYTPTIVSGRSGYERNKPRPRIAHYSSQLPSAPPYPAPHYLAPAAAAAAAAEPYRTKPQSPAAPRSFKMPSPPLAPAPPQQVQSSSSRATLTAPSKESYRSSSLPIGSQLNPDWSITTIQDTRHPPPRTREEPPQRLRSRSSSSSALVEGGGVGGASVPEGGRRPPPLHSVASEPALPQASVMLAQLLATQHSQSVYKLSEGGEAARSPRSTDLSPLHPGISGMSPATSPPLSPGSPREARRVHMHAEQKRRYNIKTGFDTLQALIPHLNNTPNAKISKAAMLHKGAEYIKQLKAERNQIKEEMENLRTQIECLNNSISNCHSLLPATGAPVSRARAGRLREMFARHVAARTHHNWKYWLFSVVGTGLLESFCACVSCATSADLVRSTLLWAEQHCSLVEMRPAVLNSLRLLCTSTDILTNPERLPDEARAAVAAVSRVKAEPT